MINNLNSIWIGSYHLFAAMARFEKKQYTSSNINPEPSSSKQILKPQQTKTAPASSQKNPKRSYVNALNGNDPPQAKSILKSITLDESNLIDTYDTKNVILAKVRDVYLIPNNNIVLNKEGFYNFHCKYIGGLWLWIEFDSHEACLKMHSNSEMSWYFTHLKHVHQNFVLDERVVWIEISGLPINAWCPKAFKKIAGIWGTPLFVDVDPNETVSLGRICIKTKIHGHIDDLCKVVILGKTHKVFVKEFADWNPDINDLDTLSSNTSDQEQSIKQDEELSDNGFHVNEEGEIPNTDANEEEENVKDTP